MVRGKSRNCLLNEEKIGLFPPYHSLDLRKSNLPMVRWAGQVPKKYTTEWILPQVKKDQAEEPLLVLETQALGENSWSLHHMDPPVQRMFDPSA